eukprot:TRINITY_DN61096_c0_g1_i1.p1 TRINITY_DN61096_c0_g1~~TRINITY_DN61096_c0_g1_i1.p1  ORF type:complete len:192 (+),score=43.29 TRINITY_DN61096_c0_g1_i1:66-641(+)
MPAKNFEFSWEKGGVIDWIATKYGTTKRFNPHDTGDAIVKCSSVKDGSPREFLQEFEPKTSRLTTENEAFSWVQVELPVAVSPTHYRMSHSDAGNPLTLPRSWAFCASYDGEDWRVLCQHTADKMLTTTENEQTGAWGVKLAKEEFYPFFRVVLFENGNSGSSNTLAASGFELFGSVRHRVWPSSVPITVG